MLIGGLGLNRTNPARHGDSDRLMKVAVFSSLPVLMVNYTHQRTVIRNR